MIDSYIHADQISHTILKRNYMQTRKQGERQFRRIKYNIPTTNTVHNIIL